ncbi:molybdopterin-synthase adenylyltransferase MoeB [uncultured Rhodoferax sp.]|uniref:HesA/MoeB/ThiF family protein n=1 Tax=uncultured Rhodoferax sp. TaxID=223188 RepID=UPI0025F28E22|nr:molybdopterin-synthase adenylyltransferase MoeB [uncultured Rhodoferax sp.]
MQDDALLRYSRHILLDEIGIEGQERLNTAHALIIGAGGLGCPAAMYLAAAGVGQITVLDPDTVDLTNLQRQIAHTTARVGQPKVDSLTQALQALNPLVQVQAIQAAADGESLPHWVGKADVVLDCSDNFGTRHAVNAACVAAHKPLVSGAAIRFDGQIGVFDARDAACACYACAFPPNEQPPQTQCATMGVFAPLVGVIGAMQAAEALKLVLGMTSGLSGRLLMLDGHSMEWTPVRLPRQAHCPVCAIR